MEGVMFGLLTTAGGDQCESLDSIESTNQESSIVQELRFSEFAREVVRSLPALPAFSAQHIIGLKHVIVSYIFPYIIDGTQFVFSIYIRSALSLHKSTPLRGRLAHSGRDTSVQRVTELNPIDPVSQEKGPWSFPGVWLDHSLPSS